jgi:hypothetical protein
MSNYTTISDFLLLISHVTQCLWLYDGGQFLLLEDRTQIHYTIYLGRDHRPPLSKMTNFLIHSDRYKQDSNRRWLVVKDLLVWDRCLNHSATEGPEICESRPVWRVHRGCLLLLVFGISSGTCLPNFELCIPYRSYEIDYRLLHRHFRKSRA